MIMDMIIYGGLGAGIFLMLLAIVLMIRNSQVFHMRHRVLMLISKEKDMNKARCMLRRFQTTSYDKALFSLKTINKIEREMKKFIGLK